MIKTCLTTRAPDAGDSVAISGSFLRLSLFLAGRLRRPHPSAGNARRGHFKSQHKKTATNISSKLSFQKFSK